MFYGNKNMNELSIPEEAKSDPRATEILRLWGANDKLNVSIRLGSYHERGLEEAHAWGLILTDLAKHVAHGLAQRFDMDEEEETKKIIDGILTEMNYPTTDIKGT